MQERLMVEAIFLLGDGLFAPKMIYSWQLVAISRNTMYLSCNECIKSRTVLHRNTIIASLTAKLKQSARACTCIFTNSWQAGKVAIKYSASTPRAGQKSRNITQRVTAEHKTDRWGQREYPNVIRD